MTVKNEEKKEKEEEEKKEKEEEEKKTKEEDDSLKDRLEAVNETSKVVRRLCIGLWSAGIMLFMLYWSITDRELFLDLHATIPTIGLVVSVKMMFIIMPTLFFLWHMYTLLSLRLLSGKLSEVCNEYKKYRAKYPKKYPATVEEWLNDHLFPLPFTHFWLAIHFADRKLSAKHGLFFIFSMVFMPLLVMLSGQARFLPYQDTSVTIFHSVLIIIVLFALGLFFYHTHPKALALDLIDILGTFVVAFSLISAFFGVFYLQPPRVITGCTNNDYIINHHFPPIHNFLKLNDALLKYTEKNQTQISGNQTRNNLTASMVIEKRNIRFAQFENANLIKAHFKDSDLRCAKFNGATMNDARFTNTRLAGANFTRATMNMSTLGAVATPLNKQSLPCPPPTQVKPLTAPQCGAPPSVLPPVSNAQAQEPKETEELQACSAHTSDKGREDWQDLRRVSFHGAIMKESTLSNLDLSEADFSGAHLEQAKFSGSSLHYANFSGATLFQTIFHDAKLVGSMMYEVKAEEADFKGAALPLTIFYKARLAGAKFEKADLFATQFLDTDLEATYFTDARLWKTNLNPAPVIGRPPEPPSPWVLDRQRSQPPSLELMTLSPCGLGTSKWKSVPLPTWLIPSTGSLEWCTSSFYEKCAADILKKIQEKSQKEADSPPANTKISNADSPRAESDVEKLLKNDFMVEFDKTLDPKSISRLPMQFTICSGEPRSEKTAQEGALLADSAKGNPLIWQKPVVEKDDPQGTREDTPVCLQPMMLGYTFSAMTSTGGLLPEPWLQAMCDSPYVRLKILRWLISNDKSNSPYAQEFDKHLRDCPGDPANLPLQVTELQKEWEHLYARLQSALEKPDNKLVLPLNLCCWKATRAEQSPRPKDPS